MNQIAGTPIILCIRRKVYKVGYVSTYEWEVFGALTDEGCVEEAILYLLSCSFNRAQQKISRRKLKRLIRKDATISTLLIESICKLSLPENLRKKADDQLPIDTKELQRNVKAMYRILSKVYNGWTPEQIGSMSPAQLYIYIAGIENITGTKKMSPEEYAIFRQSRS